MFNSLYHKVRRALDLEPSGSSDDSSDNNVMIAVHGDTHFGVPDRTSFYVHSGSQLRQAISSAASVSFGHRYSPYTPEVEELRKKVRDLEEQLDLTKPVECKGEKPIRRLDL